MTGRRKKYGETQRTAIVAALNIAAEKYEEDATVYVAGKPDANERLADQFQRQAKEARELAEEIEEFEVVEIS